MPAGYSSRCKACNSPHRLQIEGWKNKDGLNSTEISLKLKEMGESISRPALDNHFAEHYDVQPEVQAQYLQSQANLQKDAGERVSEIVVLDEVIKGKADLHQKLETILTNRLKGLEDTGGAGELPNLPTAYVSLYTGCATGLCQAMKTKQELLGEDSGSKKAGAMQSWVDLMLEDEVK
jgi:hypothetical protein